MPFDSSGPTNFAVRPISSGMIRDLPTNALPDGAFLRLQNYRVHKYGLKKRGGFTPYDLNNPTESITSELHETIYDIIYFYRKNAGAEMLYLGEQHVYIANRTNAPTKLTLSPSDTLCISNTAYNSSTQTVNFVLTYSAAVAELIRANDYLYDDANNLIGKIESVSIGSNIDIAVQTESTLVTLDQYAAVTLSVNHVFILAPNMAPSYAVLPAVEGQSEDWLIIADQAGRGFYLYRGNEYLEILSVDSQPVGGGTSLFTSAGVCTYFEDRLWIGNTEENGSTFQQRIRWTEPTQFDRILPESYVDLPYSEGPLLALQPLGSLLIAYFEDAVYVGRQTAIIGLPIEFERLETGNVGIVNSKAVARWTDGHFFVGQDDIYFLSGSSGIEQIGSPVREETIDMASELKTLEYTQVEHDPKTDTICFLFPDKIDDGIGLKTLSTRLWRFNYVTKAWSYDEVAFNDTLKTDPAYLFTGLLPSRTYLSGKPWEEWAVLDPTDPEIANNRWLGLSDADPAIDSSFQDYNSWDALGNEQRLSKSLKLGIWDNGFANRQIILEEDSGESLDIINETTSYPVWCLVESGDYDFGTPDSTKTVTRLSVKSQNVIETLDDPAIPLNFDLRISDRMGFVWKRPMQLKFKRNYNEGYTSFRSTGSTFRFKLINSQNVTPYKLSEMVIRVIGRGLQIQN